ncbi:SAM-dependent methyltransferase, partial [Kocuria atrinae]|uniref:SAM-dependent methyltransferase n=1 Tax=Kocuria atrinae TaxID=592377 RepID=UPI001CB921CE
RSGRSPQAASRPSTSHCRRRAHGRGARGPVSEAVTWAAEGRHPLAVVTWVKDGHPDHEVLAAQVQQTAGAAAVRCVQYPIWWWHWGSPAKLPRGLVHVPLSAEDRDAKQQALEHHASQVRPLSDQPGDEVLLGPHILEHFERDREYFVLAAPHQTPVFNRVHTESEDPWNVDSSRYEHRKRDVLTASLPRELYPRALDIGCSTGALTAQLAAHVGVMTAVDASDVAWARPARVSPNGASRTCNCATRCYPSSGTPSGPSWI